MSRRSLHILTVVVFAFLPSAAIAQGEVNEVLIFGDVPATGVFKVPGEVVVNEFVDLAGGVSAGTVNVRLVRDEKIAWGGLVSKGQPGDFKVAHGDIVVVHSLERLSGRRQQNGKPNVVQVTIINPRTRPLIVDLEEGKVTAGDVLNDKDVRLGDRAFRIIRTDPKTVPIVGDARTILHHGDIVMVRDAAVETAAMPGPAQVAQASNQEVIDVPALPGNGPLLIPVSDQIITPQEDEPAPADTAPVPVAANYGGLAGMVGQPPQPAAPEITSPQPPASFVPPGATQDQDLMNTDPWMLGKQPLQTPGLPAPDTFQPGSGQPSVGTEIPPFNPQPGYNAPSSQSAYNGQPSGYPAASGLPGGQNGLTPRPPAGPAPAATQQSTNSSLPLPSELDAVVEESSNSTMWYVAGLAGALFLVLGAWVYGSRAMADSPQVGLDPYKRPVSRRHSSTVKHPPVADGPGIAPPAERKPVIKKPKAPTIKPITAATGAIAGTAAAAVASFTHPEAVKPTPPPAPEPKPIPTPQPVIESVLEPEPLPDYVPVKPPVSYEPPTLPVTYHAPPEPVRQSLAALQGPSVPAIDPKPEPEVEPVPVPNTSTTRILDALINNSIPVSEQPVELPMHLDFFGDSSGPKQLRIDPAQPVLRGPHTNMSAGRDHRTQKTHTAAYDG
jgi:hypothetical protein